MLIRSLTPLARNRQPKSFDEQNRIFPLDRLVLSHHQKGENCKLYELLTESGIDVALRAENLRLSFHLYNTSDEVERVISVLNAAG